jgi:hypothetical protein
MLCRGDPKPLVFENFIGGLVPQWLGINQQSIHVKNYRV